MAVFNQNHCARIILKTSNRFPLECCNLCIKYKLGVRGCSGGTIFTTPYSIYSIIYFMQSTRDSYLKRYIPQYICLYITHRSLHVILLASCVCICRKTVLCGLPFAIECLTLIDCYTILVYCKGGYSCRAWWDL